MAYFTHLHLHSLICIVNKFIRFLLALASNSTERAKLHFAMENLLLAHFRKPARKSSLLLKVN
ncbi:hypothetical protein METHB2_1070004 [Candidatus Methylobacter favarea]|uniref:Uncharacterized protein n=1 Tax=Candidatus Methylobacter favarea TaxID=2707345 RepID=A0A8S0XE71_9GAMM|nr:hypothetical protein METHB2_1070004 [Candidatus Methylobacter favarea]